jgi:hypothetical protein
MAVNWDGIRGQEKDLSRALEKFKIFLGRTYKPPLSIAIYFTIKHPPT